jgi:hypothetical protein
MAGGIGSMAESSSSMTTGMRHRLRFIWLVIDPVLLAIGSLIYLFTKRTPLVATESLRRLYVATDGRVNDAGGRVSAFLHPAGTISRAHGVLGDLDAPRTAAIVEAIDREGYYVFDTNLDEAVCDRIVEFARGVPAVLIPPPAEGPRESAYDAAAPLATRYDIQEQRIFDLPELQELATDESLMAVAQGYLKCRPVNDLVAMWWSAAYGTAPSSQAAQLFHFDMDRLKFLKFFFYLTDVDSSHGPHVYVATSHRRKPQPVRRDGRIPDEEIARAYGGDALVEITGTRGTIIAADTSGFHKGKPPDEGDRLMFQVEYANSLFGVPYNRIVVDDGWSPEALRRVRDHPAIFQRFVTRESVAA